MKIEIARGNILAGLQKVQGLAGSNTAMPILSNVLLEAAGGKLALTGTSLDITIRESVDSVVEASGAVTINAKKLYEIVKALPEEAVKISVSEKFQMKLSCGKSSFKLTGFDGKEFPAMPAVESVKSGMIRVEAALLSEMLRKSTYSVADSDDRISLTGALVTMGQNGTGIKSQIAASDGQRLALLDATIPGAIAGQVGVIIPKKALQEMRKFAENDSQAAVELGFTENQVIVRRGEALLLSKIIDASYPNFKQAIPVGHKLTATVPRQEISGAIRRVSLLAGAKSHQIVLEFGADAIILSSDNPEAGQATVTVAAKMTGGAVKMAFNYRFLQDAISSLDAENVQFRLNDDVSPCVIVSEGDQNYMAVVMPMRL